MGDMMLNRIGLFIIAMVIAIFVVGASFGAPNNQRESSYSVPWCYEQGGNPKAKLADNTRPDCLLKHEVVEFDFGRPHKAYECTGQALHYARIARLKPVCILIKKYGISAKEFARAVSRVSPLVEIRCMNAERKLFSCPVVN